MIACYDQARFLGEALDSVFRQTVSAREVIVVDDGSHDDPAAVAARFPGVKVLRQPNAGLAAARNTGLAAATARYVVFLDADDVLAAGAIEAGLECMRAHPDAGLVYGAHRRVDEALRPCGPVLHDPLGASYVGLLGANRIAMHAAVLYDREKLAEGGGFDPSLPRCEDYDAYLRLAQLHPIACHAGLVALYRIHGGAMTADHPEILYWALEVQARHRPFSDDKTAMRAWRQGRRGWKLAYALGTWAPRRPLPPSEKWRQRLRMAKTAPLSSLAAAAWRGTRAILPAPAIRAIRRTARRDRTPLGSVDMADLASTRPVSSNFGFDRGTPVDRYYVEAFLARHRADIAGRVLEIGDAAYSRRFGQDITQQDVLHVDPANPDATIVGDLSQSGVLPEAAFDCMIVTQTLHLVYDMAAAVAEMQRALKPGGVLLLTVPGVSSIDRGEWSDRWLWSLTAGAAERLFGDAFGAGNVEVEAHGNVYAATCFLQGLVLEEVQAEWLDERDPAYPVIVTVRARRDG